MVRLTKIYTRSGDSGTTGLGTGERVPKTHQRVAAYGTVDEANAAVGVAVVHANQEGADVGGPIARELVHIQNDLFDVGADLCTPVSPHEEEGACLRVSHEQTTRLESVIDRYNAELGSLESFVLPGGSPLAAALHVARTVVRRAEREVVLLAEHEPDRVADECVRYLNRLSDLLFVLARSANAAREGDVLWVPGKHRGGDPTGGASQGPGKGTGE